MSGVWRAGCSTSARASPGHQWMPTSFFCVRLYKTPFLFSKTAQVGFMHATPAANNEPHRRPRDSWTVEYCRYASDRGNLLVRGRDLPRSGGVPGTLPARGAYIHERYPRQAKALMRERWMRRTNVLQMRKGGDWQKKPPHRLARKNGWH